MVLMEEPTMSEMDSLLVEMEYPATRDDLLREARRRGCAEAAQRFGALPDRSFQGATDVHEALQPFRPGAR